jgi:hypothetical protein
VKATWLNSALSDTVVAAINPSPELTAMIVIDA